MTVVANAAPSRPTAASQPISGYSKAASQPTATVAAANSDRSLRPNTWNAPPTKNTASSPQPVGTNEDKREHRARQRERLGPPEQHVQGARPRPQRDRRYELTHDGRGRVARDQQREEVASSVFCCNVIEIYPPCILVIKSRVDHGNDHRGKGDRKQ